MDNQIAADEASAAKDQNAHFLNEAKQEQEQEEPQKNKTSCNSLRIEAKRQRALENTKKNKTVNINRHISERIRKSRVHDCESIWLTKGPDAHLRARNKTPHSMPQYQVVSFKTGIRFTAGERSRAEQRSTYR
jgi:hypothetical protein